MKQGWVATLLYAVKVQKQLQQEQQKRQPVSQGRIAAPVKLKYSLKPEGN
jgi:hypothetical protein